MTPIDPSRILSRLSTGTLRRSSCEGDSDLGCGTVSLLVAVWPSGAEKYNDDAAASAIPEDIMPLWLATLTPMLSNCVSYVQWNRTMRRYAGAAGRWHVLGDSEWRECLLATLEVILQIALPYDIYGVVCPVYSLVAERAHVSDERWKEVGDAASAVSQGYTPPEYSAMVASFVAWSAGEDAKVTLVTPAAEAAALTAAKATGGSGEDSAFAMWAAWDRIADACLTAIERECDVVEGARLREAGMEEQARQDIGSAGSSRSTSDDDDRA